ncbi:suppressor of IKBKE 1 isoform X3 [Ascaphus truei]
MTCTIDKILQDAKTLLERLKDHDNAAESLIDQSSALHKQVEAMKEVGTALPDKYQEDLAELKDSSKYKPHVLLCQENTQIRDLQQENKELWLSLEEHQYALELIMSKYRRQMLQLMTNKKPAPTEPVLGAHQTYSSEIEGQIDRICGMGEAMRKAVQVDEHQAYNVQERLAQLEEIKIATRFHGSLKPIGRRKLHPRDDPSFVLEKLRRSSFRCPVRTPATNPVRILGTVRFLKLKHR